LYLFVISSVKLFTKHKCSKTKGCEKGQFSIVNYGVGMIALIIPLFSESGGYISPRIPLNLHPWWQLIARSNHKKFLIAIQTKRRKRN
jgi:hypothetical protein